MDFKFLAHTVRNIILNPVKEWDVIYAENKPASLFSKSLFLPLLILASVSTFLGVFLFTNTGLEDIYSVLKGVEYLSILCLVTYGTAFIFKEITNFLELGRDFSISFKIIVCSIVPFLLCQILSQILESFIFVNILSFFGLYILWAGIEKMLDPPEGKKLTLLITTTITFITLFLLVTRILSIIIDKLYFSIFA
ncbi:MAG: hypothetical protein E4H43_00430 [Bacteroidia bacterium]|nr:MAG: hypothetical protein E4H43_00430 [Bacteroidia bacterium]